MDDPVYAAFDDWTQAFAAHVQRKGCVPPNRFRAHGYKAPAHRWADVKLKWRELHMSAGRSPAGSSPAEQEAHGLNRDATFTPKRSTADRAPLP